MPTPRTSDFSRRSESNLSRAGLKSFCGILALALSGGLACSSCNRQSVEAQVEKPKASPATQLVSSPKKSDRKKPYLREGYAVWYTVPGNSLARRRAGKDELTAAHNHLQLGMVVRVTHLANGKSVVVRITDRGITKRGASIDLCKEAAEKLGMISEGMARVRIEELPDEKNSAAVPDPSVAAANP